MIDRAKKTKKKAAVTTLAGGFGGFEVRFRSTTIPGYSAPSDQQISMLWEDSSDGKDQEIGQIFLLADMDLKKSKDQKQLLFDIRDAVGKSLCGHKPLASSSEVRGVTNRQHYSTLPRLTSRQPLCEDSSIWKTSGLIGKYSMYKNLSEMTAMLTTCFFFLPFLNCIPQNPILASKIP